MTRSFCLTNFTFQPDKINRQSAIVRCTRTEIVQSNQIKFQSSEWYRFIIENVSLRMWMNLNMTMTMTEDVIKLSQHRHNDLAFTVNDSAPWHLQYNMICMICYWWKKIVFMRSLDVKKSQGACISKKLPWVWGNHNQLRNIFL